MHAGNSHSINVDRLFKTLQRGALEMEVSGVESAQETEAGLYLAAFFVPLLSSPSPP